MARTPRSARSAPRRLVRRLPLLAVGGLTLSGCSSTQWYHGGWPSPVTVQGRHIMGLWQGALLAALIVGAFVGGLIVFSAFAFRRRGHELPRQVKYNLPMEFAYTAIPVVVVAYLFYFTAITENYENKLTKNPQLTIGVVGFQWSWQFNYPDQGLQVTGRPGQPPQLVIPTNTRIRFVETSPDVIHSFWVVPFLFKRDVVPGRHNEFEVVVDKQGIFDGKCAEYCGEDHDRMLFSVRAVSRADFDKFVQQAKAAAGNGGKVYGQGYTLTSASTAPSGSNQ